MAATNELCSKSAAMTVSLRPPCLAVTIAILYTCTSAFPWSTSVGGIRARTTNHGCHRRPSYRNTAASDGNNDAGLLRSNPDTLTLAELTVRFQEVREHYRLTQEMSDQDVCHAMLRTRLSNLELDRCHVGPSTVEQAGQGLFASRCIEKGELIALYPGDALLLWDKQVGDFSGNVGVMFGNHVAATARDPQRVTCDDARNYEVKIAEHQSLVADPTRIDDSAYLAHMINDGAACWADSPVARSAYSQLTVQRYNAVLVAVEDCHYAAVAAKDIQIDQEIFVSYGDGYWLSRLRKHLELDKSSSPTRPPHKAAGNGRTKPKAKSAKSSRGGGGGFG